MVLEGLIKDCTDTYDDTEFEAQDVIRVELGKHFGYTEEEILNS